MLQRKIIWSEEGNTEVTLKQGRPGESERVTLFCKKRMSQAEGISAKVLRQECLGLFEESCGTASVAGEE